MIRPITIPIETLHSSLSTRHFRSPRYNALKAWLI